MTFGFFSVVASVLSPMTHQIKKHLPEGLMQLEILKSTEKKMNWRT